MHREIGKRGSLDMIRDIVMINEEDEGKEEENVKKRKKQLTKESGSDIIGKLLRAQRKRYRNESVDRRKQNKKVLKKG